jgi:hypothetical protein
MKHFLRFLWAVYLETWRFLPAVVAIMPLWHLSARDQKLQSCLPYRVFVVAFAALVVLVLFWGLLAFLHVLGKALFNIWEKTR